MSVYGKPQFIKVLFETVLAVLYYYCCYCYYLSFMYIGLCIIVIVEE